ncbi:unnamed protein product [Owenia fusiformis]|uniref:Uncharacterized protein n=1 Tax=Owenia fusiformis TaxID=6347 RepID=A0A8J1TZ73_OWEFU|nr:unnamed protein product [Owenia fusiformis]
MIEQGITDTAFPTVENNVTVVKQMLHDRSDKFECRHYNRSASVAVIIFCGIAMYIQINWLFLSFKGKRLHIRENTFHFIQVFVHICGILKELIIGILVALDFNECNLPGSFTWRKYLPMCRLSMKFLCLIGIVRMVKVTQPNRRIPWWIICVMSVIVCLYCAILIIIPHHNDLIWVDNVADICCFGLTVIVHSKMVWSLRKKIFTIHIQPNVKSRQHQASVQTPVDVFQVHKLEEMHGRQKQPNVIDDTFKIDKIDTNTHQTESNVQADTQTHIVDAFQIHIDLDELENNEATQEQPHIQNEIISDIRTTFNTFIKENAKGVMNKTNPKKAHNTVECHKVKKNWFKNKISPFSPSKAFDESNPDGKHHQNQQKQLSIIHPLRRKDFIWEYKLIASEVVVLLIAALFHMVIQITFRMNDSQLFHLLYSISVLCLYSIIKCLKFLTSRALRHEFIKFYSRKSTRVKSVDLY